MSLINKLIKSPVAQVYRKAYIKRRSASTGLFEDEWLDISDDVKQWGKVTTQIDAARLSKLTFGNLKLVMLNDSGRYNPHDSESSLWYGYLNQQRTLVKIEAGYIDRTRENGIWQNVVAPGESFWDVDEWDEENALWDNQFSRTCFIGVISGDIGLSDKNEIAFNVKPLNSVFQDFPANNLTGWTSTGLTASQFMTMVRDQTDGSGSFIFRPFFNNTTGNFDISTTSNVYTNLNTSGAQDIISSNVWQVMEKLSEAENFVSFVTRDGKFKFISRDVNTSTVAFEFHGSGSFSGEYGHTIKSVNSYGRKVSKYYSRVQVKFRDDETTTSYGLVEADFAVSPNSDPWVLGHKSFQIENMYIPTLTVAETIAQNIFDEYSSLKNEIEFVTTMVPHLEIFDRISITYDPSEITNNSLWDQFNIAADATNSISDLIFDSSRGDAIKLYALEFKFLSCELDLDNFQNKFIAREV